MKTSGAMKAVSQKKKDSLNLLQKYKHETNQTLSSNKSLQFPLHGRLLLYFGGTSKVAQFEGISSVC